MRWWGGAKEMRIRGGMVSGRKDRDKEKRGRKKSASGWMCGMLMYTRWACQTNKIPTSPPVRLPVLKPPLAGGRMKSDQRPVSRSNFCSYQGIDSTCLNRPAAQKVLPWQQDGNGDHNVFMVLATWGLRSTLSGDCTLPRARRVWAKSLHTRQQQNTEEPWQDGGRMRKRETGEIGKAIPQVKDDKEQGLRIIWDIRGKQQMLGSVRLLL